MRSALQYPGYLIQHLGPARMDEKMITLKNDFSKLGAGLLLPVIQIFYRNEAVVVSTKCGNGTADWV